MGAPRFEDLLKQGGRIRQQETPAAPRFEDLLKQGGRLVGPQSPEDAAMEKFPALHSMEDGWKKDVASKALSATVGATQGATLGFVDEGNAAQKTGVLAAIDFARRPGAYLSDPLARVKEAVEAYRVIRDHNRDFAKSAKDLNPKTFLAGEIGGGALVPIPGGVGGAAAKGGWAALRGAMKTGAVLGGAYGLGSSESDLTKGEVGGAVADTAIGTAGGAVGGALGHGAVSLGKAGLSGAKKVLDRYAAGRAIKAAGGLKSNIRGLLRKGPGKLQEAAKDLYEQKIVTPLASMDEVAERVGDKLSNEGAAIGSHLKGIDRVAASGFDANAAADRLERELLTELRASPALKEYASGVARKIDDIRALGTTSFEKANSIKSDFAKAANWNSDAVPQEIKQRIAGVLNSEIEEQIGKLSPQSLGPFRESKRLYGNLAEMNKTAQDGMRARIGNRMFSPSDHAIGGLGGVAAMLSGQGASKAAVAAEAMGFVHKVAREHGSQFTGALSYRAARGLERFLQKQPGLATQLAERGAATRGSDFTAAHLLGWIRSLPPEAQLALQAEIESEPVPVASK